MEVILLGIFIGFVVGVISYFARGNDSEYVEGIGEIDPLFSDVYLPPGFDTQYVEVCAYCGNVRGGKQAKCPSCGAGEYVFKEMSSASRHVNRQPGSEVLDGPPLGVSRAEWERTMEKSC